MAISILVIEDNDDFRDILRMTLDFKGYEVSTACNGAEGLELAKSRSFDLITSDIEMPKMNGIEFVRKFRAEVNTTTPIIVLSAAGTTQLDEALNAGANSSVDKPFEPIRLIQAIESTLGPGGL